MPGWFRRAAVAVMAVAALSDCARGQSSFAYAWAADTPTYMPLTEVELIGIGAETRVRVYLTANPAGAGMIGTENGLLYAAVRVSGYGSTGLERPVAGDAEPADLSAVGPWAFGDATPAGDPATSLRLAVDALGEPDGVPVADGRIWLGTFTLRAASVGVTTLTAGDPNPQLGDIETFANGIRIDSFPLGSADLVVTVSEAPVPEPAGVLLAAATGLAWSLRRARRTSSDRPTNSQTREP